ncbi:DUF6959 family protein [Streptomyces sp. NPDC058293]|uniref:DUF6959 family protein n=1 Tax=Streptomyces sp. NPDC058293 TaxID=3346429 RepID=UPI0036E34048
MTAFVDQFERRLAITLSADVAELVELCAAGDLEGEARQAALLLQEDLGAKLQRYTDALDAHGERRPF